MDALTIRFILSIILTLGFLTGTISLFLQRKNGITKAMAIFTLFASMHVSILIFLGLIDVCKPENIQILNLERITWNFVLGGWILSGLYLGWVLVKQND